MERVYPLSDNTIDPFTSDEQLDDRELHASHLRRAYLAVRVLEIQGLSHSILISSMYDTARTPRDNLISFSRAASSPISRVLARSIIGTIDQRQ